MGDAPNTLIAMLTDEERAILEFERSWWLQPGPKDQNIEFVLGVSSSIYYETLGGLVDRPSAFEYDPLTVARVRALMELEAPVGGAAG